MFTELFIFHITLGILSFLDCHYTFLFIFFFKILFLSFLDNSAMVKKNTSPEPVKTPKVEPKVGKSSLTPVHFDEMNTPQLEPKVSINKLPIGQGGLNIRRRTASPGRQV